MQSFGPYVGVITALFAAGGVLFVLGAVAYERRRGRARRPSGSALEFPCPTCSRTLVVHKNDLTPLSAPEVGLLVSATGRQFGRHVASLRCPYCESEHTFSTEESRPKWIATDTFEPHHAGTYCADCRSPLLRPHWAKGALDGRVTQAAELQPKHGLVCSRCGAICCVECVRKATRNRTKDGSYLCPRCFRGPVDVVHHW